MKIEKVKKEGIHKYLKFCLNNHENKLSANFCKKCGYKFNTAMNEKIDILLNIEKSDHQKLNFAVNFEDYHIIDENMIIFCNNKIIKKIDLSSFMNQEYQIDYLKSIIEIKAVTLESLIVRMDDNNYYKISKNILSIEEADIINSKDILEKYYKSFLFNSEAEILFFQLKNNKIAYLKENRIAILDTDLEKKLDFIPNQVEVADDKLICSSKDQISFLSLEDDQKTDVKISDDIEKFVLTKSYLFILHTDSTVSRIDLKDYDNLLKLDNIISIMNIESFENSNDLLLLKDNKLIFIDGITFDVKKEISTEINKKISVKVIGKYVANFSRNQDSDLYQLTLYNYQSQYTPIYDTVEVFNKLDITEIIDIKYFFSTIFIIAEDKNGKKQFIKIEL